MEDSIIKEGLIYIPKFTDLLSDKTYGDTISHEMFNELVTKNTEQGDYNSEVLRILFTETDDTKTYHIPYLDNLLVTNLEKVYADKDEINKRIDENRDTIAGYKDVIDSLDRTNAEVQTAMQGFLTGEVPVGFATIAGAIKGIDSAAARQYYGTDDARTVGFHTLPPALYADDASSSAAELEAIYIAPRADSVNEAMLTEDVRVKLNRVDGVKDYTYLENLPQINNKTIIGNVSLDTLDIMSKSAHSLDIQTAKDYTDEKHEDALAAVQDLNDNVYSNYLQKTSAANTYATIDSLNTTNTNVSNLSNSYNTLNTTVSNINSTVNNYRARVFVQTGTPSGAKNGDLWIQV